MITVKIADKSDHKIWDNYVISHPDAWPYHCFAWRNVIEKAYRHTAYYLMAEDNRKIVGVLPMIHLRFPYLVNELTALPYCDVGNFVCDNKKVFEKLLSSAVELGNKLKVDKIHVRGQLPVDNCGYALLADDQNDKVRMLLNLPDSSKKLQDNFKSKLRSQIRKAEKNGIIFRWGGIESVQDYYAVFSENMRDLGSPVHSIKLFHSIIENFGDNAKMGLVDLNGKTIGAGIILTVGNKVSIPWASTLRKHNRLSPNMLLYWNFMKYSCDTGFNIFDFGRSSKGEGTFKFKAQWGAKPIELDWYSILLGNNKTEKDTKASPQRRHFFAALWRKLPLPIANSLGPFVRKHISL